MKPVAAPPVVSRALRSADPNGHHRVRRGLTAVVVAAGLVLLGVAASRRMTAELPLPAAPPVRVVKPIPRPADVPRQRMGADTPLPSALRSRRPDERATAVRALARGSREEENAGELLERVIREDPDPYVRERAVFGLAELRQLASLPMLRELARDAEDPTVRAAALTNLRLIKERYPEPAKGSLHIEARGAVVAGGIVTLDVTAASSLDPEHATLLVGLPRGAASGDPPSGWKGRLVAERPERLTFELRLPDAAEIRVPVSLTLAWSQLEYEQTQRILNINTTTGAIQLEDVRDGSQ